MSLTLGAIGIFTPILPTVPFVLLAFYCFSKGSKSLHLWLLRQPYFGKVLEDWERDRVIKREVKIRTTVMILVVFTLTLSFVTLSMLVRGMVITIGLVGICFLWTRKASTDELKKKLISPSNS